MRQLPERCHRLEDLDGMTSSNAPYAGRILHVDLATGESRVVPTEAYVSNYLGGRGIAARLAWELIEPGLYPFDDAAPLILMTGALVGTPSPTAGRMVVAGLSPQTYPFEWYTRSNMGGYVAAELKYAGYDGLVLSGSAARLSYLVIEDHRAELRDGEHIRGLGMQVTQQALQQELGAGVRTLAIGPAGENRVRFAVIGTNSESVAGQGGFGAVMGAKNLKAIAIRGRGGVRVAKPAEALRRSRLLVEAIQRIYRERPKSPPLAGMPAEQIGSTVPCTSQCAHGCGWFYDQVAGVAHPERSYSGRFHCCAPRFFGADWLKALLGFNAGFELAQLANDLGLNHWELVFGLVPWILRCQERGELLELDGERLELHNPVFWGRLLDNIAHRRAWGDILAEGTPRAAALLGVGQDLLARDFPAWGQAQHGIGPYFPYSLVSALQWAMDTRDPIGGAHGYLINVLGLPGPVVPGDDAALQRLLNLGTQLYGDPASVDPRSGHTGKASPALFHQDRGALKDSLGLCDILFPLLVDPTSEDLVLRVEGVEGRYLEHWLYDALSEVPLSREAFYCVGARVYTLERLLAIRNWGRTRATDESLIAYLQQPEEQVNPFIGERVPFDRERWDALADEYYALRGWNPATGAPTLNALRSLGLETLAHDMPAVGSRRI